MKRLRGFMLFLIVCLLSGCDLIDYHPYDCRISGSTDINRRNRQKIELECAGKDTIRFAVISDTQRWYDETSDLVKSINAIENIDFVIHCGDQTDFGLTKEYIWMRKILEGFKKPFVCVIGNHDCLGTGEDAFAKIYGDVNFSFNASFLHFVCLNTNAFEYDYSVAIPDFTFIEQDQAQTSTTTRTIALMHAPPGSEQFNNNVAKPFHQILKKYADLMFCVHGHSHYTSIDEPLKDGLLYYQCGAASKHAYLLFTITKTDYTYEAFGH